MTSISRLEVHGVKEDGETAELVTDNQAHFYTIYGYVEGSANSFYVAIGDYATRVEAELVKDLLDDKITQRRRECEDD